MNSLDSLELLRQIALGDPIELSPGRRPALAWLLEQGWVMRLEAPRKPLAENPHEALQDRHGRLIEAKHCAERLQQRAQPRARLGGLLGGAAKAPDAQDPDVLRLFELLQMEGLTVRDLDHPRDLMARLDKVREHLLVADRDCLDRMAVLDRALWARESAPSEGTSVEPEGYFALTELGARQLPEAGVMEALETAFNAISGPRRHKIEDYRHFRGDPASLIILHLDNPLEQEAHAQRVASFEAMAEAFERFAATAEIRSFQVKNAFMLRTFLAYRGHPAQPFLWCHRERLLGLMERGRTLLAGHLPAQEALLVASWDLLRAELVAESVTAARCEGCFRALCGILEEATQARPLEDRAFLRLALALHNQVMGEPGSADLDGLLRAHLAVIREGRDAAPPDLQDEGARWCFGYHLAHLARFDPAGLALQVSRFRAVEMGFLGPALDRQAPLQVVLHALVSLQRLEGAGLWVDPKRYAATYRRILRRILGHREMGRIFQGEMASGQDAPHLAAYLCARAYFDDPDVGTGGLRLADVGLAGCYEHPARDRAPLLGPAFGTLMLG